MPTPRIISSGGIGGARRARLLSRGHIPIAHGYLAPPCPLEDPKPWEYDGHIFGAALAAASARFGSGIVLTGPAAAFAYGARMLRIPGSVDAYLDSGAYARCRFGPDRSIALRCHRPPTMVRPRQRGGLLLASACLTLIDIARFADDEKQALVAIDSMLRIMASAHKLYMDANGVRRLKGIQDKAIGECEAIIGSFGQNQRAGRARAILAKASILNESPGETLLWLAIGESGLVMPEQQVTLQTRGGKRRADFLWEEEKVIAEFDGDAKYQGDEGRQRMLEDRKRDHHLTELGYRVVHFDWEQTERASEVRQRLLAAGVPPAP